MRQFIPFLNVALSYLLVDVELFEIKASKVLLYSKTNKKPNVYKMEYNTQIETGFQLTKERPSY